MHEHRLTDALRELRTRDVRFVIVGGLAAVLNGAPVQTYDLDVVYSVDSENIDRLLKFLENSEAIFRIQPHRRLRPNQSHLTAGGHLNLLTRYGPLDLMGTIGQGMKYSDLLPHSIEMRIGEASTVRVLDLETVIAVKEQLSTEKDLAALPILRRTLAEIRKKNR